MVNKTISLFSTLLKATLCGVFLITTTIIAQTLEDDFEGNGNISNWYGDFCSIDSNFKNPVTNGLNNSDNVLEYHDTGDQYANIRFDANRYLDLSTNYVFSLKVYIPSNGIVGIQKNQISLKLQNGNTPEPWSNQSEIIKPLILNKWQTITFDFKKDPYLNLNGASLPPTKRQDFNRVVIQINGENNNDPILAYLDDFYYFDTIQKQDETLFNTLVWSDEFNQNGAIDSAKWFHQTDLPPSGNWYNGEIQHYTNRLENSNVKDGKLSLIAKKEKFTDQGHTKQYTSARLNSKFAFKYGRIEIRANLPTGVGTWPAIWMLGKNINEDGAYWDNLGYGSTAWPACGEIDIMEHWGHNQNYVQSATHTPSSSGATINHGGQYISTASTGFHVYALEWTKDKLVFSVDNKVHFTYNPEVKNTSTWPFDAKQYILFNIAIQPSIKSNFTQSSMDIDYIRIYQESTTSISKTTQKETIVSFPNPVIDELSIVLDMNVSEAIKLDIFNSQGVLVMSSEQLSEENKVTLTNLENLPIGLYFLTYTINNKNFISKFLK